MTDSATSWRPCQRDGLITQDVACELVVLDLSGQRVHQLNDVAKFILEQCDGTRTVDEIVDEVVAHFDVMSARAAADTAEVLDRMRRLGVIK